MYNIIRKSVLFSLKYVKVLSNRDTGSTACMTSCEYSLEGKSHI